MVETDLNPSVVSTSDLSFCSKHIDSETFVCDAVDESFDSLSNKSTCLSKGTCSMADNILPGVGDNLGYRARSEPSKISDRPSMSRPIIIDVDYVHDRPLINNGTCSVEISDSVSTMVTAKFGVITSSPKIEEYLRDRCSLSGFPEMIISKGTFLLFIIYAIYNNHGSNHFLKFSMI